MNATLLILGLLRGFGVWGTLMVLAYRTKHYVLCAGAVAVFLNSILLTLVVSGVFKVTSVLGSSLFEIIGYTSTAASALLVVGIATTLAKEPRALLRRGKRTWTS